MLEQDFLNLKVPTRCTVSLNPPVLKRSWFHNSLIIKSDKESRRPQMILSPFLLPSVVDTNVVYIGDSADTSVGLSSSQDNSRRPPLRLEREDVHWGKRRRCGGQRRSASGRAVVPHIQALISIPAAAQTHTLTHPRTSTRTHLGYNRPVRRAEIWSDLIYVHDLQLVVSWRFYKQDCSLSLLPCVISIKISLVSRCGCFAGIWLDTCVSLWYYNYS